MLIFDVHASLQQQLVITLKNRTDRTNLDKFLTSSKKVSELFLSPNIVLVTKSSILVQLCSFWGAGSNLAIIGDEGKNWTDLLNHFGQVFNYFQKVSALDEA